MARPEAAVVQRIYLVGVGQIGLRHAAAAGRLPAAVTLAVCDTSPEALAGVSATHPRARLFEDLDAMLSEPPAHDDIVVVATPPDSHADITQTSLASGRHVLCEKPMALTADEVTTMVTTAADSGRLLGCCSGRFLGTGTDVEVRRLITERVLGRPCHVRFVHRERRSGTAWWSDAREHWRFDSTRSGGGILADWGSYDLTLLLHLLQPAAVHVRHAWIRQHCSEADPPRDVIRDVEDQVAASMTFVDGDGWNTEISYERASATYGRPLDVAEIEFERGSVRWQWRDWDGPGTVTITTQTAGVLSEREFVAGWGPVDEVHDRPLHQFYAQVHDIEHAAVVGRRAQYGFECIRAIYESARTTGPISVECQETA